MFGGEFAQQVLECIIIKVDVPFALQTIAPVFVNKARDCGIATLSDPFPMLYQQVKIAWPSRKREKGSRNVGTLKFMRCERSIEFVIVVWLDRTCCGFERAQIGEIALPILP